MLDSEIVVKSLNFVENYLNDHPDENRTYHDYDHAVSVAEAVHELSKEAGLPAIDIEDLVIAGIFHDVGYCIDPDIHEALSADIANEYLESQGMDETRRANIKEYIQATKMNWSGENPSAFYLRDADLSGLAVTNYSENNEYLRLELEALRGMEISKSEWREKNIQFFKKHSYKTIEGKKKFKKGKNKNLKKLKKAKKDEAKENTLQTIGSSRAAQTQLKTSLRNHIDLSAIADNKANIMLSINAIIITVGLPLMANQINVNPYYIFPMVALGIATIISMGYATLSTRPIKMNGSTDLSSIEKKKTNLFFFGNYYKMDFDTYESGIKQVVGNDEILENSITRDLFFLGKSLGKKFDYLRICYNIFMIGMLVTVILFVLVAVLERLGGMG